MIKRILQLFAPKHKAQPVASPESLRGIPTVRRLKTYQAMTGFTWSYYYDGYRNETTPQSAQAFVFTLLGGNRAPQQATIVVPDSTIEEMRAKTGNAASSREIYALAKMHLFSMLDSDERPKPDARWELDASAAIAIWEQLDL